MRGLRERKRRCGLADNERAGAKARSWVGDGYGIGKIQRWVLQGNEMRKAIGQDGGMIMENR